MQKRLITFSLLFLFLAPAISWAQSECNLHIISNFESDCVLTSYQNEGDSLHNEDLGDCILACKGNTVSYTAACDSAVSYTWNILGASTYSFTNQNRTAVVTWGMGETGYVAVSVVTSGNNTCTAEACVRLIESPHIGSATVPNYYLDQQGYKIIEICRGEVIELTDMSLSGETPLTGYIWRTPMGIFSTPTCAITIPQSGEFVIEHEVQNECGCKDAERINVKVVEPANLRLSCYGTVCQGTTANYELETPVCSQYMWHVDGGSYKLGANPRDITVHWGSPASGYGVITVDGNFCNACNAQLSVKIPVISDNTEIAGPDVVCLGDIQEFELPLWGATDYQWYTSNTNGIQLLHTESPNKILAEFTSPGIYSISVAYECEAIECGLFRSAKTITVKDTLRIVSDNENLCVGETGSFTTNYGNNVSWKLYGQNGQMIYSLVSDTLTYTFPNTGKYKVVASGASYCNEAEFWVTILGAPPALTVTDGPHEACWNSAIKLSATPTHPRYYLEWTPVCNPSGREEGNTVTIHFEDEICDVAVCQVDNEYGCRSAAYIHKVDTFRLLSNGLPAMRYVCPEDTVILSVPDQSDNVLYEWTMSPVNAATVFEEYYQPYVTIRTNHLIDSNSFTVMVFLSRKFCGLSEQRDTVRLSVNNLLPPSVHFPDTICQDEISEFYADSLPMPGSCSWSFSDEFVSGKNIYHKFRTPGSHTFTFTYQPASGCDPFFFTDSVYVVAAPQASISVNAGGDTLSVPDQTGVSYVWYHNFDTVSTTNICVINGSGEYRCRVTSNFPPYCNSSDYYETDTPHHNPCLGISFGDVVTTCNTAVIKAVDPPDATFSWSVTNDQGTCSPTQSQDSTTAVFYSAGHHQVSAYTKIGDQCYRGTKNVTINRMPKIKLTYDCDSDRIVVNDLSGYLDSVIPDRTLMLNGIPYSTFPSPNMVAYIPTTNFPEGTYTVTMTMTDQGCVCSDSIHFVKKAVIGQIEFYTKPCEGIPIQMDATGVTGAVFPWFWNYGDGSYATAGTCYHTFSSDNNNLTNYTVSVTVKNTLGCSTSLSKNITINPKNLSGNLVPLGPEVCPDTAKTIYYDQSVTNPTLYYWFLENEYHNPYESILNNPQFTVYETGNYKVRVEDNVTGCILECMRNVGFLTAPTANITGNTEYCLGDEVKLYGNSGAGNTYAWSVTGSQTFTFTTANITFTPSLPGNYLAVLTVTSPDGCTATDTCSFTVHPQPAAPTISFIGAPCIHQPPVGVKSDNQQILLWSNGYYGDAAYYYVPGYLTAHYVDDSTGCPSAKASLFVHPAPDYDALLTGCYRKCPDDLPFYMKLNGFYPNHSGNFQWDWYYGNTVDTSGISIDPSLPVRNLGTYFMTTSYGDNCVSTSPLLSIENTTMCSCDSVRISVKKKCLLYPCDLIFQTHIFITNTSVSQSLCFDQITAYGGSITSVTSIPVTIAPLSTQMVEVMVRLSDFENGYVEFTLTDSQHQCVKRFTEYFDWEECIDNVCQFTGHQMEFLPTFSSPHQGSYFHVRLGLPAGTTQIFDFWSDPPQILNQSYNPAGFVDALLMLNYGQLTQLVYSHEYICFYAVACGGNQNLCRMRYCIPAEAFHSLVPPPFRQMTDSTEIDSTAETARSLQLEIEVQPDKPYLAPNPAHDEVAVMGIAPEEVTEITILTMQGRQVASFRNEYRFSVSRLAPASYIVRVVTAEGKVHYLKLVKQ